MEIRPLTILVVAFCASFATPVRSIQVRQPSADERLEHAVTLADDWHRAPQSDLLSALSSSRVPGGLVRLSTCNPPPSTGQGARLSLREALDLISRANPGYGWELDNGVVNFEPMNDSPTLLNVRVSTFKVENAQSIVTVLDRLLSLPEVADAIARSGLTSKSWRMVLGPVSLNPQPRNYTIDCREVTVRQALNAIVRADGRAVWAYTERLCGDKTEFSIEFVVR